MQNMGKIVRTEQLFIMRESIPAARAAEHTRRPKRCGLLSIFLPLVMRGIAGIVTLTAGLGVSIAQPQDPAQNLPLITTVMQVTHAIPDPPNQGRVNAVSVDPTTPFHVFAMTDSGGLFESWTIGGSFTHREVPIIWGSDVQFSPIHPNVVVTTGMHDFRADAGIWVSVDHGKSFTHPADSVSPAGVSCNERAGATSIAFAPDNGEIFVATDCGVSIGSPDGLTWRHIEIPAGLPADYLSYTSIAALGSGRVVIGGSSGIFVSSNHGSSWSPAADAAAVGTIGPWSEFWHAIAAPPMVTTETYAVSTTSAGTIQVSVSHDAGQHWTAIHDFGNPGACGGIGFARAAKTSAGLNLVVGDHCGAWRLPVSKTSQGFDYSATWIALQNPHADMRDVAFDGSGRPAYAGSDGGLAYSGTGDTFYWTAPPSHGLDALQMTEVAGQRIGFGRVDLYYGTQDNDVRGSELPAIGTAGVCCEGFFFSMERNPASVADSNVTYTACGDCFNFISSPLFANVRQWNDPIPNMYAPRLVIHGGYVQGAPPAPGNAGARMMYSSDTGSSWHETAAIPFEMYSLPQVSRAETPNPVVYHLNYAQTRAVRVGETALPAMIVSIES